MKSRLARLAAFIFPLLLLAGRTAAQGGGVVYLPLVVAPAGTPVLDPDDRGSVRAYFLANYMNAPTEPPGWTGSQGACQPGTTRAEFRETIVARINFFRAMAGVPATITLRDEWNRKAQAAALMFSANRRLSHAPTPEWLCYTEDGREAAGRANIYLGAYGPTAITGFMQDAGANNAAAGHRRWLLYPQTETMGTGDVPPGGGFPAAHALWAWDETIWGPRPATRHPFVAWPPPDFVPYPIVFARWSFALPDADFSAATVTMRAGGAPVPLTQATPEDGYGENTLVWTPLGLPDSAPWPRPEQDTPYTVTVSNVRVGGQPQTFTYTVTIFDPARDE